MSDKLYQEELLEHYKYPKYRTTIENPDFTGGDYNPSCGDRVAIQGTVNDGVVTAIGFSGSGCVISQAAASMVTEACLGKTVADIQKMTSDDIKTMIKIPLGPTRLKCALLSLYVLQQALNDYTKKQ
jgi:nitrogen fixation NifU-like protein